MVPEGVTVAKLLYVVVVEEDGGTVVDGTAASSFRYTRSVLQSALQLMGCKPRHAFKVYVDLCVCICMFICFLIMTCMACGSRS